MNPLKVVVILIGLAFPTTSTAQTRDTTLIGALKGYILSEAGFKTRDQFFNTWSEEGKPAVVVYVNSKSSIGIPGDGKSLIIGCKYDETRAKNVARHYDSLGFHTLVYKTYGTGRTELSPRFLAYSPESISFIVLHEFIHHYTMDRRINIPLAYYEALGDVIGNYGTIEFASQSNYVNKRSAKEQRSRNEYLYKTINKSIGRIERDSTEVDRVNAWCQRRIDRTLKDDLFQKDRFDYKVNNAYLFRYRSYTEKYFVLKRVLEKHRSIHGLLDFIEKAPGNPKDFENYLRQP